MLWHIMLEQVGFCGRVSCCLLLLIMFKKHTGIYDITGPSVEINFMGYAVPGQRGTGIHLRLKARAYAFEDENKKRFVFVSLDGGMGSDLVNMRVVEKLNAELGEGVYSIVSYYHPQH